MTGARTEVGMTAKNITEKSGSARAEKACILKLEKKDTLLKFLGMQISAHFKDIYFICLFIFNKTNLCLEESPLIPLSLSHKSVIFLIGLELLKHNFPEFPAKGFTKETISLHLALLFLSSS